VIPTEAPPQLPSATAPLGPTATLIPLPTFTYIFPTPPVTQVLWISTRQPDEPGSAKMTPGSLLARIIRFWPLMLLCLIWIGLAFWFVVVRRRLE
jgi:hypothetical protein